MNLELRVSLQYGLLIVVRKFFSAARHPVRLRSEILLLQLCAESPHPVVENLAFTLARCPGSILSPSAFTFSLLDPSTDAIHKLDVGLYILIRGTPHRL